MKEQENISCIEPFSYVKTMKDPNAPQLYEWLSKAGRYIWPVYFNLFKQQNKLHGKGILWDAGSLYIGAEVNFVYEAWSKSM